MSSPRPRRLSLFDPVVADPRHQRNVSTLFGDADDEYGVARVWDVGLLLVVPCFVFVSFFAIVCVFIRVFERADVF